VQITFENTGRWYIGKDDDMIIMSNKLDSDVRFCIGEDSAEFLENLTAIRELYAIPGTDQYFMTWDENLGELFKITTWSNNC
jgi:hypothetical protein